MSDAQPSQAIFPGREARDFSEFIEDALRLLQIPEAAQTAVVSIMRALENDDPEEEALEEPGLRWLDTYQALRAMRWLEEMLLENGAEWLHTVLDGGSSEGRAAQIRALLEKLEAGKSRDALQAQAEESEARKGVLPAYEDVVATHELRGVFVDGALVKLFPVASIRVDLDSGSPRSLSFQVTQEDLQDLITELEEFQKNLRLLDDLAKRAQNS